MTTTTASSLRAEVIWYANFESYPTKSGTGTGAPAAAPLQINTSGAPETFSGTQITSETLSASSCEVIAGDTGNALVLKATGNGSAGTASIRLNQSALSKVADGGVLVISFDLTRSGTNGFSLASEARSARGRSGKTVHLNIDRALTAKQRVTIVVNQSGKPVALPGSLGELADKSSATYLYDGTAYTGLLTSGGDVNAVPISGFVVGVSRNKLAQGATLAALFDNFGAWNSIADTVNNVSVLSLAPGTVISKP